MVWRGHIPRCRSVAAHPGAHGLGIRPAGGVPAAPQVVRSSAPANVCSVHSQALSIMPELPQDARYPTHPARNDPVECARSTSRCPAQDEGSRLKMALGKTHCYICDRPALGRAMHCSSLNSALLKMRPSFNSRKEETCMRSIPRACAA